MTSVNNKILKVIAFITMTYSFIAANEYGNYGSLSNNGYIVMAGWILLFLCNWALNGFHFRNKIKGESISWAFVYSFIPKAVIYAYTIFLIFSGMTNKEYFSSNIQTFINGLSAIALFYFLGQDSLRISVYALVMSYIFLFLRSILIVHSSLEFHDLAFSVGYIVLFFLNVRKKWRLRIVVIDICVLIMILLAGKRIGMVALMVSILWMIICNKLNESFQKKFVLITGGMLLGISLLFVNITLSPDWMKLVVALNINTSGRNYYYAAMADYAHFGIDFMGLGRNACQVIMSKDLSYFHVGNIHSDILRMYIEDGFLLFIIWLLFYLIIVPILSSKQFKKKTVCYIMTATLYTFIVYFTDNTELYLMNQFFYVLTILVYIYRDKCGYSDIDI